MNKSEITSYLELLSPKISYGKAKAEAEKLDKILGFDFDSIEKKLSVENRRQDKVVAKQFWIGLDAQSLQTPYSEVIEMIQELNPQPENLWIDLGAGYGRLGVVLGFLKPEVKFLGYEFIESRVNEGNRIFTKWDLKNAKIIQTDLASQSFDLQNAEVYFLYDFGSQADVYLIIEKLRNVASKRQIKVIARGRGIKNWILLDFPWLAEVNAPVHFRNWSLFRS